MASILLSNAIIRKLSPNLLKPALTTNEKIVGSISKCIYETMLLKTEFTFYTNLFGSLTMFDILIPLHNSSFYTTSIMGMTIVSAQIATHPSIIPIIRTSYGIYKKNIHIIN